MSSNVRKVTFGDGTPDKRYTVVDTGLIAGRWIVRFKGHYLGSENTQALGWALARGHAVALTLTEILKGQEIS